MDIVSEFPEAVLKEAESIPDKPSGERYWDRNPWGADAKDSDDAVHIALEEIMNYHIADASHIMWPSTEVQSAFCLCNSIVLARATNVDLTNLKWDRLTNQPLWRLSGRVLQARLPKQLRPSDDL